MDKCYKDIDEKIKLVIQDLDPYRGLYNQGFHDAIMYVRRLFEDSSKKQNLESEAIGELVAGSYEKDEVEIILKIKKPINIPIQICRNYRIEPL